MAKVHYTKKYYQPFELYPEIPINRVEIIPGVVFKRSSKKSKNLLKQAKKQSKAILLLGYDFNPNYELIIDVDTYDSFQRELIEQEVGTKRFREIIENNKPFGYDYPQSNHMNIVPQALLSILLFKLVKVKFKGIYSYRSTSNGDSLMLNANTKLHETNIHIYNSGSIPEYRKLKKIAFLINRYFRPYTWFYDRVAFALISFWNSFFSFSSEQAFLSLFASIEALLTSNKEDISRQVMNRYPIIIGAAKSKRQFYGEQIKELYSIRSRIIHGNAKLKKGAMREQFYMSLPYSHIPYDQFGVLYEFTQKLLLKVLFNEKYFEIVSKVRSETTTDKHVEAYFNSKMEDKNKLQLLKMQIESAKNRLKGLEKKKDKLEIKINKTKCE